MFCNNCGNQLPDGAAFCVNCGAETVSQAAYQQPVQPTPVVAPVREQMDPELNSLAKNTMIMGIIGLALSELGIPGIILSSMALNKAAEFERRAGSLYGKAKVGRNLAKPGKIVGIVMTILWAFIIVFYGFLYGILLSNFLYY